DPRAVEAEEGAVRADLVRRVVALRHALAERPGGQITREAAALQRRGPHHARGAPVDAGDAAGPRVLVGRVGAVDETIAQVVFGDGRESVDADEAAAAEVLVLPGGAVVVAVAEQPAGDGLGRHAVLLDAVETLGL